MGQWGTLIPLILMFVVFYFLLIRPQQKRQKERMAMLNALKKGDKVITIGGIHGTIVDLTEDRVTLKVSDNTRLVFERSSVNSVVTDEDASAEKVEKKKEEKKEQAKEESK
jgi:preprotein translocase subunit YajC